MGNITVYSAIFFSSCLKFVFGPVIGMEENLSFWETSIFTCLGMMTSVVIFAYFGESIRNKFFKRKKKKKLFSRKSRRIVKIYQKFGIRGIAFLTPLLLTPIGGTLIAVSFGVKKRQIIMNMLPNAVLWSIGMSFLFIQFRHFFETVF